MKKKILTIVTVFEDGTVSVINPNKETTTGIKTTDDTTLGADTGSNNPPPPRDP